MVIWLIELRILESWLITFANENVLGSIVISLRAFAKAITMTTPEQTDNRQQVYLSII